MENQIKINEQITVGAQPTEAELRTLNQKGFKTVINLRVRNEEDQLILPEDEGEKVRDLGMTYLNLPVSASEIRVEQVDDFRNAVDKLPKPIFVHCNAGKRSGAFAMMQQAAEQGWSGDETLRKAEEMGFECDSPELIDFVKEYVDQAHAK
jgi:uncharacterized protein (TIGR01244 family)